MPLAYMLRIMRDETADEKRRDAMALASAPYLHPKMQTVQQANRMDADFSKVSTEELSQYVAIGAKMFGNLV